MKSVKEICNYLSQFHTSEIGNEQNSSSVCIYAHKSSDNYIYNVKVNLIELKSNNTIRIWNGDPYELWEFLDIDNFKIIPNEHSYSLTLLYCLTDVYDQLEYKMTYFS